jgi:hypothetical protein
MFCLVPNVLQQRQFSFAVTSCSIFQVVQRYRHWRNVNLIFYKTLQKQVQGIRYGDRGRRVCTCSAERSLRQLPVQDGCGGALSYCRACNSEQFHDQCLKNLNSQVSNWRLVDKRGTFGTGIECEKKYICVAVTVLRIYFFLIAHIVCNNRVFTELRHVTFVCGSFQIQIMLVSTVTRLRAGRCFISCRWQKIFIFSTLFRWGPPFPQSSGHLTLFPWT